VILALLAALGSAVCYGVASVLQALGARATARSGAGLVRVLRQAPFVVGVALDVTGFVLQALALRRLPLFVVQAAQAGNLAVTAVVAVPVLGVRLTPRQWAAVGGVTTGLALLALSAGAENAHPPGVGFRWGLLACALALVPLGLVTARFAGTKGDKGSGVGAVAGLGFGVTALGIRALDTAHLVHDPALYAVVVSGVAAFLFFTVGLQRGSVTAVSAAVVVGETALPALVGVLALGDHTRTGYAPAAVAGFLLAVAGALVLSRFTEPATVDG
jgi:drug/metabolite transporter (DMT)-like permease